MPYQQVTKRTRGELGNVLDYQLKALTKGDYVLYFKKCCERNFCIVFFGCFVCVIDVVLELCIIGVSFKDEMCIIDPWQRLRKESMWLYREKMEKRLLKKGKKMKRREDVMSVCQLLFTLIQAARTKVFYEQESMDSTIENPTLIARLRLERKRRKTNTKSLYGCWNEKV